MKAKKLRKIILSFALSAALLAQPVAGIPIVRAEEVETTDQLTEEGASSDDITIDDQESGTENDDREVLDDLDKKDDETGNPGKEDENGEKDEETDGSTEGESGDTTDEENPDDVTDEEELGEEDTGEGTGDLSEAENSGTVSGNEIDEASETSETPDLDGFSDMPSNYRLTPFQQEMKADMPNALSQLNENDEGLTYAEGQVYTFASSQEEAEMIAEAYHAEIVNYSMGVLTLQLSKNKTVKAALQVASDMNNRLPAVWPNYRRELYGEVAPEAEENMISGLEVEVEEYSIDDEMTQQELEDGIISPEVYEQALSELSGGYDPYLSTGSTSYQWFHNTIGSPYAWDAGYQGLGVTVGVIDSGIDSNSDLSGNVIGNYNFCGKTGTGDSSGHGTHVAGIIAALKNGSAGTGVAPQAKIYNAKVFDKDSELSGMDSTIMAAINFLISEEDNTNSDKINDKPARVDIINMSLGGPGFTTPYKTVLDKAYEKGVIVFAATGNDGGSLTMVPAACDHVIGVAATDNNNQRAYFSNYGPTADLAAPGVDIWATYGTGAGYEVLQGTSMACPVAAGEAAVILSGQDALPALKGKTGKARVNAVESIMKGNTISVGSGMGKGITSLTKVFKLSTAAAKPNAPTISATDTSNDTAQSMDITIKVQAGMKICYTTNGKNPVYKNGEAGAGTTLIESNTTTISVSGADAAKGTVKAIAVNASGVISSVKSYTYTLKPFVTGITISGPKRVEQGKVIQLTATVTPAYATNKAVEWKLTKDSGEVDPKLVKIDAKGKITTTSKSEEGTYTVTATAKDASGSAGTYTFDVIKANTGIQNIAFAKDVKKELWLGATPEENKVSLFDKLSAMEKTADGKKNQPVEDMTKVKGHLLWTSSKPAVATVDSNGNVTAQATGTTTITVKTDDNLAKKATVNITVKQAVTGIEIQADNFTVAAGKSLALKANLQPSKPAPTNKKVNWSIAPASDNSEGEADIQKKVISINKANGKITVKATAKEGKYIVTAEAADGKGAKAIETVTVVAGAIGEIKLDKTKVTLFTTNADGDANEMKIKATIKGVKGKETDFVETAYKVTNSDASVVTATAASATKGEVEITLKAVGNKYGKANVVIASTDGSNKKATCVVTVSGGISKVELVDGNAKKVSKLTLFRKGLVSSAPDTATLYAKITGSKGANKTAYEVTSNSPLVKVVGFDAATGKIDLEASAIATGKATITVMATDGSKKKATCTVTVVNPVSNINIAPAAGTTRYVVPGKSVQLTATIETEFGAISNKKVKWSMDGGSAVSVNASGKVSVNKWLMLDDTYYADVTATAQDGSGVKATYRVYLTPSTTKVLLAWNAQYPKGTVAVASLSSVVTMPFVSDCTSPMMCTTSSAGVASPTIAYSPAYYNSNGELVMGSGYIRFVTTKKGKATLTVKALDSSGKSDSMVVQVK